MSEYLFDKMAAGAPEDARKAKAARKAVSVPAEAEKPAERLLEAPRAANSVEFLGRCDEGFVCGDSACGGAAGDIVAEDGGWWLVACFECCTMVWMKAQRSLDDGEREFRFRGGQHDGKSLAEVQATPGGGRYLAWAAEKHPRPFVREAVKKWLTSRGVGR